MVFLNWHYINRSCNFEYCLIENLQRESSKLWWLQRLLASLWFGAALYDSTALSTNRFLINWSGCLDWTDLHSGQYHSFWPFATSKRQSWQKVWPQESAIRTGGLNISFLAQNIIFNENDQNCTVKMGQSYVVGDKIHKFVVFLGICNQYVNLVTNVFRLKHLSTKSKQLPRGFYGGNYFCNVFETVQLISKKVLSTSPRHIEQVKSSAFISLVTQNLDMTFIHSNIYFIRLWYTNNY